MTRLLVPLLGTAASGVLLLMALPPVSIWQFGWVCFVPLFAAVRGRGFLVGFISGLLSCLLTAWLAANGVFYSAKAGEGEAGWIYTGCFLFGFVAAITAGVAGEAKRRGAVAVFGLAALATLLEAFLLVTLPAHIALTQWRVPGAMLLASVTGIWGVSFLLWAANMFLADAIHARNWKVAGAVACAFLAIGLPGLLPMSAPKPNLEVGLVQTPSNESADLTNLTTRAAQQGAKLVVWPEFAGYVMAPGGDSKEIRDLSAALPGTVIVTSFADNHQPLPRNTAAAFAQGEESERYYKRQLFGAESKMHTPGNRPVAVRVADVGLGLNICFDSCYPFVMRETARAGDVDLLALPTIDPPSPYHWIAGIHAAYTPFRAAELGTPVARADGYAYSMVVDGSGRIVQMMPPQNGVAVASVAAGSRITVYKALGDWFLFATGAMFLYCYWPRKRRSVKTVEPALQSAEPADREGAGVS